MLEVGNGGMTTEEYRSHFSLWAMLAAPLMAGNDLANMTPEIREILTNKEVIAVDQDRPGRQGTRVAKNGDLEVWSRPLADGSRAVILFNRGADQKEIAVDWTEIGYPAHLAAKVRDLWQHKNLGTFTGKFSAPVASHGVVMVRVTVAGGTPLFCESLFSIFCGNFRRKILSPKDLNLQISRWGLFSVGCDRRTCCGCKLSDVFNGSPFSVLRSP